MKVGLGIGRILRNRQHANTTVLKPVYKGFHDMGGSVAHLAGMGHRHDADTERTMLLTGTVPYRVHSHVAYSSKCFWVRFYENPPKHQ